MNHLEALFKRKFSCSNVFVKDIVIGNCTKLNILTPASLILVVPHTLAVFWYFRTFITRGVDLSAIYRAPIVFIHFLAS